jgi:hypothetical protein
VIKQISVQADAHIEAATELASWLGLSVSTLWKTTNKLKELMSNVDLPESGNNHLSVCCWMN